MVAFGGPKKFGGTFGPKRDSVGGGTFGTKANSGGAENNSGLGGFGVSGVRATSKVGGGFGPGGNNKTDNTSLGGNGRSTMPVIRRADIEENKTPGFVKKPQTITFSNVEWRKFDNILHHPSGAEYNEPRIHVNATQNNIEFHGYNISAMDEGVFYGIGPKDGFEIECEVDTTKIKPHPGGHFYINFGIISAMIDENGGDFLLNGSRVATVGSHFTMKLSLSVSGKYEVFINGIKKGERINSSASGIRIVFGFKHDSHNCKDLSHAYVSRIKMKQYRTASV